MNNIELPDFYGPNSNGYIAVKKEDFDRLLDQCENFRKKSDKVVDRLESELRKQTRWMWVLVVLLVVVGLIANITVDIQQERLLSCDANFSELSAKRKGDQGGHVLFELNP